MAGKIENRLSRRRAGGFTLIELMVVIALIGVIASLVISVGSGVRIKAAEDETRARLRVLQGAVETFNDTMGRYPDDVIDWRDNDHKVELEDPDPEKRLQKEKLCAQRNMTRLLAQLSQVDSCRKMIDQVVSDARDQADFALYPTTIAEYNTGAYDHAVKPYRFFIDSFDQPLNYQRRGGAGGTPVVISAGDDNIFGTGDDLRSDDQ